MGNEFTPVLKQGQPGLMSPIKKEELVPKLKDVLSVIRFQPELDNLEREYL